MDQGAELHTTVRDMLTIDFNKFKRELKSIFIMPAQIHNIFIIFLIIPVNDTGITGIILFLDKQEKFQDEFG